MANDLLGPWALLGRSSGETLAPAKRAPIFVPVQDLGSRHHQLKAGWSGNITKNTRESDICCLIEDHDGMLYIGDAFAIKAEAVRRDEVTTLSVY